MIDLVTPKSLKKSTKKKSKIKSLDIVENEKSADNVKLIDDTVTFNHDDMKPTPKRRRQDQYQEPESTVPDEDFMMPTPNVEFVKSEKALSVDELTIPSDLDDPNNCQPLSRLIGCQSVLKPENHLKCVWSIKRKVLKKNRDTCKCYSELERRTLDLIRSNKILKSKRKFNQHFNEFEDSASKIQCQYPYCKQIPEASSETTSKLKVTSKLVRKSKKRIVCPKTKTAVIVGEKRPREQESVHKVRYSKYFINEITQLMLDNKSAWNVDILIKLLKTKQLKSSVGKDVASRLIESRDLVTLKQLIRSMKTWTESDIISLLTLLLSNPAYLGDVDGKDKQELDLILVEILTVSFELSVMKRMIRSVVSPHIAKVLLMLINDKLLNTVSVYTQQPTLNQVIQWCEVLIEVYFSTFITETALIRKIYNNINQHITGCRMLFGLNEHLFRIKHPQKFK